MYAGAQVEKGVGGGGGVGAVRGGEPEESGGARREWGRNQ